MCKRLVVALLLAGCGGSDGATAALKPAAATVAPAIAPERSLSERLEASVVMLAQTIGERNLRDHPEALDRAAKWLAGELAGLGTVVEYSYEVDGRAVKNLEVVLPGRDQAAGAIVVGAHYDSAIGTPGADDNASGVAVLLELGRLLADKPRARELRLVGFVNEEPPYFQGKDMGSLVYAKQLQHDAVKVVAMVSIESVGFFADAKGSQKYPPPLSALYPDVGNFIAIVGNSESAALVDQVHASFSAASPFPVQKGAFPGILPGVGWSDHWSFWQTGVAAVMITDTAPFRNPHYHEASDQPSVIDSKRLAQVTLALASVIGDLTNPD